MSDKLQLVVAPRQTKVASMPSLNKWSYSPRRFDVDKILQLDEDLLARPFRLVSLFEMLKFQADWFVNKASVLAEVYATSATVPGDAKLSDVLKQRIREKFPLIKDGFTSDGLQLSVLCVDDILNTVDSMTVKQLGQKCDELGRRIHDELSLCLLLRIPSERKTLYEEVDPFGAKVTGNFGSAAYDTEEASKCLALDRSTACVMHLMRTLEAGIDAIALGVGVKITAVKAVGTWEQLLNMIRDAIQANNKANAPPWTAARPFFESALTYLHAVKDAWRNPVVHAESKYTPDEAERIYSAVKHLMMHLAEHLDEAGKFTP